MNGTLLALITASFFWGVNFVLAGSVLADLTPLWAAALRFLSAAAILLPLAWWRGERPWTLLRRYGHVHLLLGLLGMAGFNILFFRAMQHASADSAALIMATNPLLTALLAALLLGERVSLRHLLAMPAALLGVAVVVTHGDLRRLEGLRIDQGDALMLAANLVWALFNLAVRRFMPRQAPLGNTALAMACGALLLTLLALGGDGLPRWPGPQAGMALALMILGGTILAYLCWNLGIARIGAGRAALFLNLVPVFAMLASGLTGTLPTRAQWLGGAIVLASVGLAMMPVRRRAVAQGAD